MPTVNCLVELVESPATVVAMPSVAIVNLERVGFNLRNFDMVIVFKVRAVPLCHCIPRVRALLTCALVCMQPHSCRQIYRHFICLVMTIIARTGTDLCCKELVSVKCLTGMFMVQSPSSSHAHMVMLLVQDLTKDVFRIDAIPSQSLDTVREWLSSMDIKFYENKVNLNWKQVLKSIVDVRGPSTCCS